MKGKKTGDGTINKTKEVKVKAKKNVRAGLVPVQNTTKKKKINVGANDYLPKENESLLENKVFFSWKVSVPFQIIWFIFLLLFTIYTLLISFAPKIETIATFPMAGIDYICPANNLFDFYFDYDDFDYETINIPDGKGNNINGIYVYASNISSGLEETEEQSTPIPESLPPSQGGREDKEETEIKKTKTVYYFKGNGGSLECFFHEISYINNLGYNVMAYNYPGYGESTGFPHEEVVSNFSQKFFEHIQKEKGLKNEDLIIWGFSIGAAVAVDFASNNDFDKIVLLAPFSSKYDFVLDKIGFIPQIFLFLKDSFVTKDLVKNFGSEALILHGNADKLVPFKEGMLVYASYSGKKYFIELDGISHNNILSSSRDALKNIFKQFLETGDLDFKKNYLFLDEKTRKLLELENEIDFYTDSSLQRFVTSDIPFDNMQYVPEDLVYITSEYISDMKGGIQTLRAEARDSLNELGKAFYEEFGRKLGIVSAYRSYSYQAQIKQGCGDTWCAKPGYSEHQSGLAVDVFEASNEGNWRNTPSLHKYFDWLVENAHKYGFHNTYQKGVAIDGYEVEPWHWRYMGVDLATYLHENNMTLAEYYRMREGE